MKFLILAGGKGTRLWPVSRKNNPKQFQKLISDRTMLQETTDRILSAFKASDVYISTNKEYETEIIKELPEISQENIICEPANRERVAAFALAIAYFNNNKSRKVKNGNETMVVMPSDHFIEKSERLLNAIISADKFLEKHPDYLVALGVKPTNPETGYGYIKSGEKIIEKINSHRFLEVDKFMEKPNLRTARQYVKNKNYFWNSGIYVWKTETILKGIKEFIPDIYERYLKINKAFGTKSFNKILAKEYPLMDKVSPEYAILENYKKIAVVQLKIGWSDIGSWSVLKDVLVKPKNRHYVRGEHLDIDSKNLLVYGSKKLVITVGLKDLVIVDTDDVILICDKNETQKVKKAVEMLEKNDKKGLL